MDKVIVEDWLKFYSIKNYTINEDLSVDVALGDNYLKKLPIYLFHYYHNKIQ